MRLLDYWVKVKGWDNYSISYSGKIRSGDFCFYNRGHIVKRKGKILKPFDARGYEMITVTDGYIRKYVYVHRLIAEAFIPNPNRTRGINHKNGIKSDNSINNLEWATQKENIQHAKKIGLLNLPKRIGKYHIKKCENCGTLMTKAYSNQKWCINCRDEVYPKILKYKYPHERYKKNYITI